MRHRFLVWLAGMAVLACLAAPAVGPVRANTNDQGPDWAALREAMVEDLRRERKMSKPISVLPRPQKVTQRRGVCRLQRIGIVSCRPEEDKLLVSELKRFLQDRHPERVSLLSRQAIGKGFDTIIVLGTSEDGGLIEKQLSKRKISISGDNPEKYALLVEREAGKTIVLLVGETAQARYHAFATLKQLVIGDTKGIFLPQVTIIDWPEFSIRSLKCAPQMDKPRELLMQDLSFLPDYKINIMFLGRNYWKQNAAWWDKPYSEKQKRFLRWMADFLRQRHVETCVHLHPFMGKSGIAISDEADIRRLLDKVDALYDLGLRWFCLCFDDMAELPSAKDRQAFSNYAQAHIHLCKRLYEYLSQKPDKTSLIVCPSVYCAKARSVAATTGEVGGMSSLEYIKTLGEALPKDIFIYWTGNYIRSPSIRGVDADKYSQLIKRKPFVWDNSARCYGYWPLGGRAKNLAGHVSGYMLNHGILGNRLSLIPALTTADYLWNPGQYHAEESLKSAAERIVGKREGKTLKSFIDSLWRWKLVHDSIYVNAPREVRREEIQQWAKGIRDNKQLLRNLKGKISDPILREDMKKAAELLFSRIREGTILYDIYRPKDCSAPSSPVMEKILRVLRDAVTA